jgi:hypothetical protein
MNIRLKRQLFFLVKISFLIDLLLELHQSFFLLLEILLGSKMQRSESLVSDHLSGFL